MPRPFIILSQSESLIQIVDINSDTKWQSVQIRISWLERQGISGSSRARVKDLDQPVEIYILNQPVEIYNLNQPVEIYNLNQPVEIYNLISQWRYII